MTHFNSSFQLESLSEDRERLVQRLESTKEEYEGKMAHQKSEMRKLVEIVRRAKSAEADRKEEAEKLMEEAKEAKTKMAQLKAKIQETEEKKLELEQRLGEQER